MKTVSTFTKRSVRGVHSNVEQLGESCYEHIDVSRLDNVELKDLDERGRE